MRPTLRPSARVSELPPVEVRLAALPNSPGNSTGGAEAAGTGGSAWSAAGGEPAHVVRDLHQRAGERAERAGGERERVVRRERLELVRRRDERMARHFRDAPRDPNRVLGMRVESRAHGRAADRELEEVGERL